MYHNSYSNIYLAHYGVKGMKWGVRRHHDDIVVRKGRKIQRISTSKEDTKNPSRAYAYASYLRKDRKKYEKDFSKLLGEGRIVNDPSSSKKNSSTYKITYRNKNALVSPSFKRRIEYRNKVLEGKQGNAIKKEMIKTAKDRFRIIFNRDPSDKEIQAVINQSNERIKQQLFGLTISRSKTARDAYFQELGKEGYNAVVDDADSYGYAKSALIILDRYKDLEYKDVKEL